MKNRETKENPQSAIVNPRSRGGVSGSLEFWLRFQCSSSALLVCCGCTIAVGLVGWD
jgi:hypothetical protein